jgi:hypothetical protein
VGQRQADAPGAFVSQSKLNAWVDRVGAWAPDFYLVAKAIAIAIRRRARPGTAINVRWLSYLTGLPWKHVLAVINNLRNAGRLRFTKTGVDLESRFLFTITTASEEEEAWARMQLSPRTAPASAAECAGVKIYRVPAVPEWRTWKY